MKNIKQMNLAFVAEAGAGKDFAAEYIIKKYGYSRYAFADKVREVAKLLYPDLYGDDEDKNRELLQAVGTKGREIDINVWVNAMFRSIDTQRTTSLSHGYRIEDIVVTDCRMPNEYKTLKERGFTFIRVVADDDVREARMRARGDIFKSEDMNHHTESFYDTFECDYSVDNNGTPEELYRQIDAVIEQMSKTVSE